MRIITLSELVVCLYITMIVMTSKGTRLLIAMIIYEAVRQTVAAVVRSIPVVRQDFVVLSLGMTRA